MTNNATSRHTTIPSGGRASGSRIAALNPDGVMIGLDRAGGTVPDVVGGAGHARRPWVKAPGRYPIAR